MSRRPLPGLTAGLAVAAVLTACAPEQATPPPSSAPPSPTTSTQGPAGASPPPSSSPSPTATSCADLAASLTREEQVGQLLMVGISANQPPSDGLVEQVEGSSISSILLLENTTVGLEAVKELTDAVRQQLDTPEGIDTLVAADQEGGLVQRLQGPGFTPIPSAAEQAELGTDELRSAAEGWGEELSDAGVDMDLAPVADVVPEGLVQVNEPIGKLDRGYGSDPEVVAEKVQAVVEGLQAGGVATSVKHFPGIGRVRGNTDFTADVVDDETTVAGGDLRPFQDAVDAGADSVMVSTVTYTRIDEDEQAVFSDDVITDLLRGDLGFDGVVVSDDMGVAAAVASTPVEDRLVEFLEAGGDLAITADPLTVDAMVQGVLDQAEDDEALAASLPEHVERVLTMKARYGLADCEG
ncbi:glycoside hydrolase family 3 protein [Desertihabitans brevis]|uniref:beta-N-acetylhexosaminidase n=1 Tax=Desertihabitans brevis TaxID=2268447 RepID=A0A367YTA8_9ACTN|nr:glycoside hydrolase family 3 N-terminal domain-containing protein [Desertihabitans brevis]RCK69126.1 glycoside hydrolase family 3 protein [Desertihabitans brevis]